MCRTFWVGFLCLSWLSSVAAQNNVVVIPMAGDDVALAQQHFRYNELKNSSDSFSSSMCESDVFNTPAQATQVAIVGNANARFPIDSPFWSLKIEFNKNSTAWLSISAFSAFAEAKADGWSQISTTDILDLDPSSSYQFRLRLFADGAGAFSSSYAEYCELMITASYKLPAGRNILEIAP